MPKGVGKIIKVTNTIFFISRSSIPDGHKVAYDFLVYTIHLDKAKTQRTRLTDGSALLDYVVSITTRISSLKMTKLLVNTTIFTEVGRFITADIKDFYYSTLSPLTNICNYL